MVSPMTVSGSKKQGPPWVQKCILYLCSKGMLYYTISTIGDDCSSENRPKGPSFLLMKRLAEMKKREKRLDRLIGIIRRVEALLVLCEFSRCNHGVEL
jgi:hypothetical protein